MISFKVYRACLALVFASVVSVLLSWRFRIAQEALTESKPLPRRLLDSYGWFSRGTLTVETSQCTLENFSGNLHQFNTAYMRDEQACLSKFFESCITDSPQILVHNGEAYDLDVNKLHSNHQKYLNALAYMLAVAYDKSIYLDMDFDSRLIVAVFSSTFNTRDSIRAYGLDFDSQGWIFESLIDGRRLVFSEHTVNGHQAQIVENVKSFISSSEPLRLRNWWKYGFEHYISNRQAAEIFQCLREVPKDNLYMLYTRSTGFADMPLGGANRLTRIKIDYSTKYQVEKHRWIIEYDFDCKKFTEYLEKTLK